jgi:hypothetical protein
VLGFPCRDAIQRTALVKKHGKKKNRVTIGAMSFTKLKIGSDRVSLKLNRCGLGLLRRHGYRLTITATARYKSNLRTRTVRGEVYWGHADQDQSMTPESIATLDQAMDDAGVHHTTELYEGAQHGYTMSDMGAYNEAAAERHFTALFALLQRVIPR